MFLLCPSGSESIKSQKTTRLCLSFMVEVFRRLCRITRSKALSHIAEVYDFQSNQTNSEGKDCLSWMSDSRNENFFQIIIGWLLMQEKAPTVRALVTSRGIAWKDKIKAPGDRSNSLWELRGERLMSVSIQNAGIVPIT